MSYQYTFAPASRKAEMYLNSDCVITVFGGAMGSGKALKHGTPVLCNSGFKNIEDLKVGEFVKTPSEGIQEITAIYPQGVVDIYRVTFQDGSWVDTCGNHLWETRRAISRTSTKNKVISTLDIKKILEEEMIKPAGGRRWPLIPLCGEVEFTEQDLPIHPYVLGAILGDGGMTGSSTVLSCDDQEIIDKFNSLGYTTTKLSDKYGYYLPNLKTSTTDLGIRLKSHLKFIPEVYKNGSVAQRYELLQGLMDTDGTVGNDYSVSFTSTSEKLANDVRDVIHSLGGTATITERYPAYTYLNEKKVGLKAYTLYVRHPNSSKLFHLTRKKERCKDKVIYNRVLSVEPIGQDFATCISISGERKVFITKDFLVTHNTYNGLLKFLRWTDDPFFRGVVIRKSSTTIMKSGGIFDTSKGMFRAYDPDIKINHKSQKFTFPSGSEIAFTHLDTDEQAEQFRGSEFSHALLEEASELKEDHVLVILSRLRSKANMTPSMGITCNPAPDHFLRKWVDWYLLPEGHEHAGRPDPSKDGVVRYFLRINNEMIWADTKEELFEKYKDHTLPDDDITQPMPVSFTFISGNIFDNPILMKTQPQYLASLKAMKRVKQERDLWGNWNVREETSGFWKAGWCKELLAPPARNEIAKRVRAWDIAGSKKSETNTNPDYTASTLMTLYKDGRYAIEDVFRFRGTYHEVYKKIADTAKSDGTDVQVLIPQDAGAAGLSAVNNLQQYLAEQGIAAKKVKTSKSKLDRFRPFAAACESGAVDIVKGCGTDLENKIYNDNGFWYSELEGFVDKNRNQKDDIWDTMSDCFTYLATSKRIPNFMSGIKNFNLSTKNPLNQF